MGLLEKIVPIRISHNFFAHKSLQTKVHCRDLMSYGLVSSAIQKESAG
jgi:hypothetical protein